MLKNNKFFSEAKPCTAEQFIAACSSEKQRSSIVEIRRYQGQINAALADGDKDAVKRLRAEKDKLKRSLIGIIPATASITPHKNDKGKEGTWRNYRFAQLSGLANLDIDHVDDPRTLWLEICKKPESDRIMLAWVSPSGEGLKLIFKLDPAMNIADNQRKLAAALGVENDEAVKDPCRLAFLSTADDILRNDEAVFSYQNKEYEQKWGNFYRKGNKAQPVKKTAAAVTTTTQQQPVTLPATYHGVKYSDIMREYENLIGKAEVGDRHNWLLTAANHVKKIVDNKPQLLMQVLRMTQTASSLIEDGGEDELQRIAADATALSTFPGINETLRMALQNCGVDMEKSADITAEQNVEYFPVKYWNTRFASLVLGDDVVSRLVRTVGSDLRAPAVITALSLFSVYLGDISFLHYDKRRYWMSALLFIIGEPSSGKSFMIDFADKILAKIREDDTPARNAEQKRKDARQDKELLDDQPMDMGDLRLSHALIRVLPPAISNSMMLERMNNAVKEDENGVEHYKQLVMVDSETQSLIKGNTGAFQEKRDILLKSFQHEMSGSDYRGDDSFNGSVRVGLSGIFSGQERILNKFLTKSADLGDGLVERMMVALMPTHRFMTIPFQVLKKEDEEEQMRLDKDIRLVTEKLDTLTGDYTCYELTKCVHQWCEEQCEIAKATQDRVRDMMKNRHTLMAFRLTLTWAIVRQIDSLSEGNPLVITRQDIAACKLIGDYLMETSLFMFGHDLQQMAKQSEGRMHARSRSSKLQLFFNSLPAEFCFKEIEKNYLSPHSARTALSKLVTRGLVKKVAKDKYQKQSNNMIGTANF